MRIETIHNPFHFVPYQAVDNKRNICCEQLPILRAEVDDLPQEIDAIVACADLQGRESRDGRLLGILLANEIVRLNKTKQIPPPNRTGVFLCGDMFSRVNLDRRGGMGDVRDVWKAFASVSRWVAGVVGNHDIFGKQPSEVDFKKFIRCPRIQFLDGDLAMLDGLKIAGLSGIIGNPRKPFRRNEADFATMLQRLLSQTPDVLLMHMGPVHPNSELQDDEVIRGMLASRLQSQSPLVICGHKHWEQLLLTLPNGIQILNVCSRCVVFVRSADVRIE